MLKGIFKIHYLIRLIIFWMAYFALFRMLFIMYHHTKIMDGQHSETVLSFLYALRLDLSTACAIVAIPYVLWVFQQFYRNRKLHLLNLAFNCGAIIFVSFVSILNFKIYGEFGTMLNARAFDALVHSKESLGFVSLWSVLLLIIVSLFFAFLGIKVYRRYVFNFSYPIENVRLKFAQVIIFPILLGIFFRGGLQSVPINENSPHYSDVSINNYIATNNIWYLAHSFLNPEEGEDVYFH